MGPRAWLQIELGHHEGAERELRGADGEAGPLIALAWGALAAVRGETETALMRFDDARARARSTGDSGAEVAALLHGARVLLDRDGPADASAAVGRLADARSRVQEAGLDRWRLELQLQLARARAATGDVEGGIADAAAAADAAREGSRRDVRWRALGALAGLESSRGSEFVARRHEQAAMEVLESICGVELGGIPEQARTLPPPLRSAAA